MRYFGEDTDYIWIEKFEAGFCRFKINYIELENRIAFSPFMSPEICSGGVLWHLSYSNAFCRSSSIPRGSVSLNICIKTFGYQQNFELSILDRAGNPLKTCVSRGASPYDYISLLISKSVIQEEALVDYDGWFVVECKTT